MSDLLSVELLSLQTSLAGRYSLEREIGRGGMGIVLLARDVTLDRPVAVKLLPPEMTTQTTLRERFLREARTAAKLSHPNIIPIFSVEEVDEFVFFVMAYVEGDTLGQRVREKGPMRPDAATEMLRQVAWALAYAHAQGVVHRDVKPDNIMLERQSGRVLVTDFGIAQVADSDSAEEPTEVLGTPDFMSPEQATGEPVTARSDIYALGATAFFTITGEAPFSASSPSEVLAHHIRTPAPRISSVVPAVPRKLDRVVARCLAKEPDDRFQSGESLAEALAGTLVVRKETPVAVRLFVEDAKKWREHKYWSPLVGLYFGGSLLATGATGAQLVGAGVMTAAAAWPLLSSLRRTRRVIDAGFEQADVVRAFQNDLDKLEEELRFRHGDGYARTGKIWRNVAYAAFGGVALGIAGALTGSAEGGSLAIALFGGGAVIAVVQARKRSTEEAARRIKFWRGRLGRWLFAVAGRGVPKRPESQALTGRPTEMAIGMAVDSLFRSLPEATRKSMPDLPDVVQQLEGDAQRLRSQLDELENLLATSGMSESPPARGDHSLAGQRQGAVDRIRRVRDEAQRRFSDTVAALERLRIDLLRIRAGSTNVDSVTANLGSARDLGAQIDRLLAAHEEIDRELEG